MSPVIVIITLVLVILFMAISLLPVLFSEQDYDSLVQRRE